MTTPSEDTGTHPTTASTSAVMPSRVRASSSGGHRSRAGSVGEGAVTTAEIPSVEGPSRPESGRGYARPDQRHNRPRREPAAIGVRLVVWFLFFLLLVALVGLAVQHFHPTWISFLRNTGSQSATTSTAPPTSNLSAPTRLVLQSSNASGATYEVPTASYSLVLVTAAPCYVTLHTPANAKIIAIATTITPQMSPKDLPVHGSSSIVIAHSATSISVRNGSKVLGTISSPKVAYTYTFLPAGT